MVNKRPTYATMFIRVMTLLKWPELDQFFYEAYIRSEIHPDLTNHIFLVLEQKSADPYRSLQEKIKSLPHFHAEEVLLQNKHLFIFRVPEQYQEDYNNFLRGAYSRFSDNYKALILKDLGLVPGKLANYRGRYYTLVKALYPDEKRRKELADILEVEYGKELAREAECWAVPNMERETLTIDKITQVNE